MSSLVLSQVTLTSPSKVEGLFIPKSQVDQVAKGLQQNEFLKNRVISAEKALNKADEIIKAQEKDSELNKKMIDEQNKLIINLKNENLKLEELHLSEIEGLNAELELVKKSATKTGKQKFWKGVKVGGISVAILGGVATVLLLKIEYHENYKRKFSGNSIL